MVTEIKDRDIHTCVICGFTGRGVSEHDRYDRVLKRDSTAPICDEAEACLDRAGWYRRELELIKGGNLVRVWKFDKEDEPGNPLIVDQGGLSAVLDELANSDVGDRYTIRIEDMPVEQLNALPEWGGW